MFDEIILDGSDWRYNYFLSDAAHKKSQRLGTIENMNQYSGESAQVYSGSYDASAWLQCTIPGCARSALLENGEIDDPYFGRNVDRSRWVEEYAWWFRREFSIPAGWQERKIYLDFSGVDYEAAFYLNGKKLGEHADMFVPARFEVSKKLLHGEKNILCVRLNPPPKAKPSHYRQRPADYALHHRCQMSWGWDWARHLVQIGIWDSVKLTAVEQLEVSDCWIRPLSSSDDCWDVNIQLEIESRRKYRVDVTLECSPYNFSGETIIEKIPLKLNSGINQRKIKLSLHKPRLWFPNGYGEANLYKLKITLETVSGTATEIEKVFGCREITMTHNPGSPAEAYPLTFNVNGKKIFIRGANWVPADMMPARLGSDDYRRQVRLATEANFNILRIWGGGLVEKDDFYRWCDEYGILVWQEFMHSCSNYPKHREYMAVKRIEGASIIKRLRSHPSLAMWCGGNEMMYYGETPNSPVLKMYQRLVQKLCPDLDYHFSSPDRSRPGERDHGPWNWEEHEFYNKHFCNLASEIGCNGIAAPESLQKFIPANEMFPPGPSWQYHFAVFAGHKDLFKVLQFFDYQDHYQLSTASQLAQADTLRYIMEHYRRQAPQASGCMIWQFNESWPTCAWSFVDYYTRPKAAYYYLKRACAPVALNVKDASWRISNGKFQGELFIINDSGVAIHDAVCTIELIGLDGTVLLKQQYTVAAAGDGGAISLGKLKCKVPEGYAEIAVLFMRIEKDGKTIFNSHNLYSFSDFKALFKSPRTLQQKLTKTSAGEYSLELCNDSKVPLVNVRVEVDNLEPRHVWYNDNCISLRPGELVKIKIQLDKEIEPEIRLI
jgi:beta-mannosidase